METASQFLIMIWNKLCSIEFFGFGFSCGAFLIALAFINLSITIFHIRISKRHKEDD